MKNNKLSNLTTFTKRYIKYQLLTRIFKARDKIYNNLDSFDLKSVMHDLQMTHFGGFFSRFSIYH